jgi:hypothetical protein
MKGALSHHFCGLPVFGKAGEVSSLPCSFWNLFSEESDSV